jgi:hypothetical protein
MRDRLPLILSVTALVVAVFGSAPLGRAAADALPVPLAKRAYLADTAKNSIKVNNIRANRMPTAGMLLPLDQTGKFPASVGAIGPKGDRGDKGSKGDTGAPGVSGYQVVEGPISSTTNAFLGVSAACPQGTKPLGGGGFTQTPAAGVSVRNSFPSANGWLVVADAKTPAAGWNYHAFVICAKVAT